MDAERFVAGAGNREVVSCGRVRGECRCNIGIGVWADVVWRGWNRETAWQGCVMCVLRWVFPLDFWRESRTKRSFWRLDAQPSAEIVRVECAKCRRECDCPIRAQPSAEIVRVECVKCRRECDFSGARATLCGDRACRARDMQASTDDFVVQL